MTKPLDIKSLSTRELLELYNAAATKLGRRAVNRFADRATALKRTGAILAELPKPAPAPLELTPPKARRSRGFNFPVKSEIKKMRKGTLRAHIRDFLIESKGATFAQVVDCVAQYDKAQGLEPYGLETRPYEALRLLHLYCGYGLQERDGKIHLLGAE